MSLPTFTFEGAAVLAMFNFFLFSLKHFFAAEHVQLTGNGQDVKADVAVVYRASYQWVVQAAFNCNGQFFS